MDKKALISFVVPVFNEEDNVGPLREAVERAMKSLPKYDYEIIFTDNHSTDRTFERLAEAAKSDARVRALRFSRNFGYQRSILTGYTRARGSAAIQLDCDLQDPPSLIPEFIRLWEEGHHVVYGVRRSRKEGWCINIVRSVFYRLIDKLSEDPLPRDAGDFRLVDRRVIEELKKVEDSQPYLRGTLATLGFNQIGVPYDRDLRSRGESKFSLGDMISLALDGILNHSVLPLRAATYVGLFVAVATFLMLLGYLASRLLFGQHWPAGFATTTILLLLSISLNAMFLGVIGEYLGRIYRQIKRRPLTIVERELNF
ncbi:MAG: glycosyltransferase family 2 protein [Elusimicrobia bacterium]|nr:glycosyltransferase family 2 protein [Elusimicrobiota bacterium]